MVRVCLGLHPSAVARFVTWRLQGSGTGLDTIQSRDNESRLLKLVQSRVATNLRRCVRPKRACARESLGKEESDVRSIEETFRRNPVGPEPTRKSLANSRKRVLRPGGVTPRAKRRQRVSEPAHPAPKLGLIVGAPAVRACGGRACSPVLAWEGGPAGVFRSRRGHLGVPQEPGRPVCSRRLFRLNGSADPQGPGPCGCRRAAKGAKASLAHGGRSSANPMSLDRRADRSRRAS